ncbi:MAG TPA: hypothetical protein VLF71_01145 [Candidatus Saccharimonadales bacterium]|nr:hypothetical protein [Candidatus Saccharimonadales bacterium]
MSTPKEPDWLPAARAHATDYLHRFVNNPGVERVVYEFDKHYHTIKDPNKRIDYLSKLAAEHWDYRKGRERFEITETYAMDDPGSPLGKTIYEGAAYAEMGSRSMASLKHYSIMAILGGANKSVYNRLRFGLEQDATYDMLAYLGSERELLPPEQEQVKDYARGARTEFDLGKGAITALMDGQLTPDGEGEYDVFTSEWHITRLQKSNGVPVMLLSSPPFLGGKRANTADTYDFLRRLEQEAFTPTENILFVTGSLYRYAQYFDAMREICLRTGVDIETIGFEPEYAGLEFKPTQFLQELKAAADAAVRLRNAVSGDEEKNEWRKAYYNRFNRID